MKISKCFMSFVLMGLAACSSSRDITDEQSFKVRRGEIIVLRKQCYFIDNPGVDQLLPVDSKYLDKDVRNRSAGIVAVGTKVKFTGAFAESGYMVDTHTRTYGQILDGTFRRRAVSMDSIMWDNEAFLLQAPKK